MMSLSFPQGKRETVSLGAGHSSVIAVQVRSPFRCCLGHVAGALPATHGCARCLERDSLLLCDPPQPSHLWSGSVRPQWFWTPRPGTPGMVLCAKRPEVRLRE